MPTVITGDPTHVTTPLARTVSGAANNGAGLIRITTSAAHLFGNGDTVIVASVGGVTAANGTWVIAVIDATHFDLVGSTFAGTYTSGGTATDASLTPQIQVPLDGEALTMRDLLSAIQALADRTQYLQQRTAPGTYRVAQIEAFGAQSVGTSYFTAGSWGGNSSFDDAAGQLLGSINAIAGDIVVADFCTTINANLSGTTGDQQYSIKLQQSLDGGTTKADYGTALASIRDSGWTSGETKLVPMTLRALRTFTDSETLNVYINGCVPVGSTAAGLHAQDAWTLTLTVLRAN